MAEEMRRSEFATLLGVSKGRITQIVSDGKLVLTADGKMIDVDASLDLLAASSDIGKLSLSVRDVIQRRRTNSIAIKTDVPASKSDSGASDDDVSVPANPIEILNHARAANELKRGEQIDIDLAQKRGVLVSRAGVEVAFQTVFGNLRAALDKLPDNLALRLAAETDQDRIYSLLVEEVDRVCEACRQSAQGIMDDI